MDSWRWQEESPTESLIRESLEDTSVIIDDADNLEFLGETRQDLRFPLSARQEPQGGRLENDLAQSQSRGGQPLSSFLEDRDWSSRDNDDFCLETGRKRADCQDDVLVDCVQLRWLPLSLRRGFRCVVSARVPSRSTRRMRGLSCLSAIWVSRSRSPRDSSALCEKDDVSVMTISPRTCQESPLETLSQTSQRDPGSLLCNTNLPLD